MIDSQSCFLVLSPQHTLLVATMSATLELTFTLTNITMATIQFPR